MKIRDVMTSDVETCHPDTDLATVVRMMWDRDCGFIPVVDAAGMLRGVVTDDVTDALRVMRLYKVRRMPVIDLEGAVKGVISMNDIVLASEQGLGPDAKEIVSTLAAICVHRMLTPERPGTPGTPAGV